MKKLLYFLLLLLPVLGFAQSRYGVEGVPMCWTTALGVDSSIVRYVLVSTTGKPVQTIVYENANGAVVTVSGGTLKYGFCDCAGGGALDSLLNGSVTWPKLANPVKDSINKSVTWSRLASPVKDSIRIGMNPKRDTSISFFGAYNLSTALGDDVIQRRYRKINLSGDGPGNLVVLTLPDGGLNMTDVDIFVTAAADTIQVQAAVNDGIYPKFRKVNPGRVNEYKCLQIGAGVVWKGSVWDSLGVGGGNGTESVINIASFAPAANGTTNDSTAFAQAIAAAVAGGYKRVFLNGKNYYAKRINNPYGIEFFGGGLIRVGPDSIAYISNKDNALFWGQEYLSAWQKKVIANLNDTIRVVYSGDSTTEGGEFVQKTTQYLTELSGYVFKSFNRGYSAQTTTRWDTLYLKQDTTAIPNMDIYVVRWGINDGFFNLGLASFQTRLRSGLAKLRAWKNSTKLGIVLMTPNSTSYTGTKSNEAWHEQINAIIRKAARDYQCFFFDTYSLMKDANSSKGLGTWLDAVETHPITHAQRLIAGELARAIVPHYLVRPPGTDFRPALQANTLPLTVTPDAFINGVTFRQSSNSSGSWPTDGIVITYKSPNAALQYLFPSIAGQTGSKPWTRYGNTSAWSAWDQRPYTQISGGVTVVAGNAAPSTYAYDASHLRITDSLNGSLMNFRSIDNITLQFAHSYLTDDLFYRNGFSGSWLGGGFRRVLSLPRSSGIAFFSGAATNPNNLYTANVGSLYFCTANGNLFTKATGTSNTGWVQRWDANDPIVLPSGTAAANTGPLKFTLSGHTQKTIPEAGLMEPSTDGTRLLYTPTSGVSLDVTLTYRGSGSPEGVVTAPIGSIYINTLGGASTTMYIKESGIGNTGWVAK